MPKKASQPSLADIHAAPGGAAAVDRAVSVLAAFQTGDVSLSLTELAERTRLYKSTVLRLLASLEHGRLIQRTLNGQYALGAEIARLHSLYTDAFSMETIVMPALHELVRQTRESAAFHVLQGEHRLCLYRVDSPQPVRDHIKAGDILPSNQGAGGRVLTAFTGGQGELYERIRRDYLIVLKGDRTPELSGISSPVFNEKGGLAGAVTLTMPTPRLDRSHAALVLGAAQRITRALGGQYPIIAT